jgi:hypothetical protein
MATIVTTNRIIFFHAHEAGMAPSRPWSSIAWCRVSRLVRENLGATVVGEISRGFDRCLYSYTRRARLR